MKRREQRAIGKRIASWTLAVVMGITMLPVNAANVYAQTTGGSSASAGGDAFSAIGIDTSVAPDGFDANNTIDNPYGRSTIKMNTVSELYTVGLDQDVSTLNQEKVEEKKTGTDSAKGEVSTHIDTESANLTASLHGDGSGLKTITEALNKKNEGNVSTGTLSVTGNYTKLNSATHNGAQNVEYTYTDYLTGLNTAESEQGVMYDVAAGNLMEIKPVNRRRLQWYIPRHIRRMAVCI